MMGAAMLKRHQFVQSLWALYRLVVSSITWGSQAQHLLHNKINPMLLIALCLQFCVERLKWGMHVRYEHQCVSDLGLLLLPQLVFNV